MQAIHGLGGVGKTQLALEYSYRYGAEYQAVWWIRAEEPTTLQADFASLARELGLSQSDTANQNDMVQSVKRWLEQKAAWLLVFDNACEPHDLREFLPKGGKGHVIITSRNPNWRIVANPVPVTPLSRPDSLEFLLRRTDQKDESAATRLAELLGDLPLALEQAGAYMDATGRSLADYLDLYQAHNQELLRRAVPTDYPATVATTWEISFQQVQEVSTAGAELLDLCAFLAPEDIPTDLLAQRTHHFQGSPLAGALASPLAFDDALAALRRFSLVEVSSNSVSVHRLVQAMARDRMPQEDKRKWAETALHLVA